MIEILGLALFISMIASIVSMIYFVSNIVSSYRIFSTKLYMTGSEDPLLFFKHKKYLLGCVFSIFWLLLTVALIVILN